MSGLLNWNLNRVKQLIRLEKDAKTIMEETGIKPEPLRTIVMSMNRHDGKLYMVKGLFD